MRQSAVSAGRPSPGYVSPAYPAHQELGPQEISRISLKRASVWSRLAALPLAAVVLPLMAIGHFGSDRFSD